VTTSKLSIFYGQLVSGFFQLGNVCIKFLNIVPCHLHHVAFAFTSYNSIANPFIKKCVDQETKQNARNSRITASPEKQSLRRKTKITRRMW